MQIRINCVALHKLATPYNLSHTAATNMRQNPKNPNVSVFDSFSDSEANSDIETESMQAEAPIPAAEEKTNVHRSFSAETSRTDVASPTQKNSRDAVEPPTFENSTSPNAAASESFLHSAARGSFHSEKVSFFELMQRLSQNHGSSMFQSQNSEYRVIIENLNLRDDSYFVMECARDLSERLLMMDAMTAERTIPSNDLTNALVQILSDPIFAEDLELHLVVCRCLFNLVELYEDSAIDAISNKAIQALLPKISDIVYIDLTEQCLQTLEVLTTDRLAHSIFLENGGINACLKNLDFLTTHSQKKCLKIISNVSASIAVSHFTFVVDSFHSLLNILLSDIDPAINESTQTIIFRIIACFKSHRDNLEALFPAAELVVQFMRIAFHPLATDNLQLATQMNCHASLEALASLALASTGIRDTMLQNDIGSYIRTSIAVDSATLKNRLTLKPHFLRSDKLSSTMLNLIACFIPTQFREGEFSMLLHPVGRFDDKQCVADIELLHLKSYLSHIFPVLVCFYEEFSDIRLKARVLSSLCDIISILNFDSVLYSPSPTDYSDFVATVADAIDVGRSCLTNYLEKVSMSDMSLLSASCYGIMSALKFWGSPFLISMDREGVFSIIQEIVHTINEKQLLLDDSDDPVEPTISHDPKKALLKLLGAMYKICTELISHRESMGTEVTSLSNFPEIQEFIKHASSTLTDFEYRTNDEFDALWKEFRTILCKNSMTGHELKSLNLLSIISKLLSLTPVKNSVSIRAFISVFYEDRDTLSRLIHLLQSILSKQNIPSELESKALNNNLQLLKRRMNLSLSQKLSSEGLVAIKDEAIMALVPALMSFDDLANFLKERLMQGSNSGALSKFAEKTPESCEKQRYSVDFYYNGKLIKRSNTIYGTILGALTSKSVGRSSEIAELYSTHEVLYDVVSHQEKNKSSQKKELAPPTDSCLVLLSNLNTINENFVRPQLQLEESVFVNFTLSLKLQRMLESPLIAINGLLPEWCYLFIRYALFLFPIELKLQILRCLSFGLARTDLFQFERLRGARRGSGTAADTNRSLSESIGHASRIKLRVSRDHIFKSAMKILREYGLLPSILEIEFMNEIGTGLGPTLEFYSLVSQCFSTDSGMWRHSAKDHTSVANGLFPASVGQNERNCIAKNHFKSLGQFIARAIFDSRNLDFYLNPVFIRAIQNWPQYSEFVNSSDLETLLDLLTQVDPVLSSSLTHILSMTTSGKSKVGDLCLSFVQPGCSDLELVENGKNTLVTNANVHHYLILACKSILVLGIASNIDSFREGFSSLLPLNVLNLFSTRQFSDLMGNGEEDWTIETLKSTIGTDHGYSDDSEAIRNLLSILNEFTRHEQRDFLQFLTGSPRLPIGGFAALEPKLTIVKKFVETGMARDEHLPSVMTCANYLKLPDYSLRAVMKMKILQAIKEGSGEFLLS